MIETGIQSQYKQLQDTLTKELEFREHSAAQVPGHF